MDFQLKLWVIRYDPVEDGQSLSEKYISYLFGGKTAKEYIDLLTNQQIEAFKTATNGLVNFNYSKYTHLDTFPTYPSLTPYTFETYDKCQSRTDLAYCDARKYAFDYVKWLESNKICEQIAANDIDEVWIYGMPYIMTWEAFVISGKPAPFITNGAVYQSDTCKKTIHFVNPMLDRPDMTLHNFGHRFEVGLIHMKNELGSEAAGYLYNDFIVACGDTHVPFNTAIQYDVANQTVAVGNCLDWKNIPSLKGEKITGNCTLWGCNDFGWQAFRFSFYPRSSDLMDAKSKTRKVIRVSKNFWYYLLYPDFMINEVERWKYNE